MLTGMVTFDMLKRAGTEFVGFLKDSIKEAAESEKVEAALAAALDTTGKSASMSAKHFNDYAGQLQDLSIYDDEAIKGAQTLLIQLTNLDQKGLDAATRGSIGLASVLKVDLQSASQVVTKAMEGNFQTLGRYGIKVRETGTLEEKRADLLAKLEVFYKRAEAETDAYAGAMAQLKNSYHDTQEQIGNAVVKSEGFKDIIVLLKTAIQDFGTMLSKDVGGGISLVGGAFKTVENMIRTQFGPALLMLRLESAKYAKEQKTAESVVWAAKKAWEELNKVLKTQGIDLRNILPSWLQVKTAVTGPIKPVVDLGAAAKTLGVTLRTDLLTQLKTLESNLRTLTAAGQLTPKAIEEIKLKIIGLKTELGLISPQVKATEGVFVFMANAIAAATPAISTLENKMKTFGGANDAVTKKIIDNLRKTTLSWTQNAKEWVQAHQEAFSKIKEISTTYIGGIDAIIQQSTNNRMLNLDQEYQKRLEVIKNSTMSEEEKNKAIEGLDAEYSVKRRGVLREAAQQGKFVAIANAIINTAEGMTKALGQGGIFGPILAAIVGAFGAVQIALIRAQAIPLAEGGIVTRPTMGLIGEAGPEAIIPLNKTTINNYLGRDQGGKRTQTIMNIFKVGDTVLVEKVCQIVEEQSRLGRLKIHSRAIA